MWGVVCFFSSVRNAEGESCMARPDVVYLNLQILWSQKVLRRPSASIETQGDSDRPKGNSFELEDI